MKLQIVALVATALAANAVHAAPKSERNREEGIGVGAGGVVGAIVGGPVGFIIGAATGAWAGGKFHSEREAREAAEAEVVVAEARSREARALAQSLEALVAGSEDEIEELQLVMRNRESEFRTALQQAFEIEVYFHTGEAALDEAVASRIERLGSILSDFDDLAVVVEGHADPRGDSAYNDQLSADRATAVREALIRAGLRGDKITTRAAGELESQATEGDLDAMALERRVNLSIVYPLPRENRVARQ